MRSDTTNTAFPSWSACTLPPFLLPAAVLLWGVAFESALSPFLSRLWAALALLSLGIAFFLCLRREVEYSSRVLDLLWKEGDVARYRAAIARLPRGSTRAFYSQQLYRACLCFYQGDLGGVTAALRSVSEQQRLSPHAGLLYCADNLHLLQLRALSRHALGFLAPEELTRYRRQLRSLETGGARWLFGPRQREEIRCLSAALQAMEQELAEQPVQAARQWEELSRQASAPFWQQYYLEKARQAAPPAGL